MANLEHAVQYMEKLCQDDIHGYSQYRRWASQGNDRDCSSSIIESLQIAGFDTGQATNTINMSENLCSRNWIRMPVSSDMKRGDILLNDANHVVLYLGNGSIAEFSISETGYIDGIEGDQTGQEAWVRSYYDYPWNCILRYVEPQKEIPKEPTREIQYPSKETIEKEYAIQLNKIYSKYEVFKQQHKKQNLMLTQDVPCRNNAETYYDSTAYMLMVLFILSILFSIGRTSVKQLIRKLKAFFF